MGQPKTSIILLSHNDIEFVKDEFAQRQTWAKESNGNFNIFWLIGDPKSKGAILDSSDYIRIPIEDTFENILKKTVLGLEFALKKYDSDYFIRSNTSSYFDQQKTLRLIKKLKTKKIDFAGYHETFRSRNQESNVTSERFVNGSGIFLSRNAARILVNIDMEKFKGIPDDVAITRYLNSQGFTSYKLSRNNICYHRFFVPRAHIRVKGWDDRNETRSRMFLIHRYFQSRTFCGKNLAWLRVMKGEFSEITDKNPIRATLSISKVAAALIKSRWRA